MRAATFGLGLVCLLLGCGADGAQTTAVPTGDNDDNGDDDDDDAGTTDTSAGTDPSTGGPACVVCDPEAVSSECDPGFECLDGCCEPPLQCGEHPGCDALIDCPEPLQCNGAAPDAVEGVCCVEPAADPAGECESCVATPDCIAGAYCVDGRCRRGCSAGGPTTCTSGFVCSEQIGLATDFCLPACDPLGQDCGMGQRCYVTNPMSGATPTVSCAEAGEGAAVGESCALGEATACEGRAVCVARDVDSTCPKGETGDGCCAQLCAADDECTAEGQVCVALAEDECFEAGVCAVPR